MSNGNAERRRRSQDIAGWADAALAQRGGVALGAQAGPAAVGELAGDVGFSQLREVAQTLVNVVLELRP